MSGTNFRAEEWVYVADSMGRLGQGYYKNRTNPSQTITVAEFEKRRVQPVAKSKKNTEQNINKNTSPAPSSSSGNGLLASSIADTEDITPWDNPIVGEQTATSNVSASSEVKEKPKTIVPTQKKITKQNIQPNPVTPQNGEGTSSGSVGMGTGASGGGSSDAKVICSELVRQGKMLERDRRACTLYAFSRLSPSFMEGYHFWAVPYVRLMRQSKLASWLILHFVKHRTCEIRKRLKLQNKGSFFGRIICGVHDPLCSFIGRYVESCDYHSLYKETGFSG